MKRILKFIGLLLLLIVAFVLIAGLFISKDYHFERSIAINAPAAVVWNNVHLLGNQQKWSPWLSKDPAIKQHISGTDGSIGAVHSWSGNKEVGSGSQTIISIDPLRQINTRLDFKEPFESTANAFLKLENEQSSTKVTWGFSSEFAYPSNVMKLFFNLDKQMDKDFTTGLEKLKNLSETETASLPALP